MANSIDHQILMSVSLPEYEIITRKWIREELNNFFSNHIDQKEEKEEKEELLTVNQVAELLSTTVQNIHKQKREGKLPFTRLGRRVYFKRSEVISSLETIQLKKQRSNR